MDLPLVTLVTPTRNRRAFIPQLVRCVRAQTWPADRLEWILLDDGTEPIADLLPDEPWVRLVRADHRIPIGTKRNQLCELASGEIIVHLDDDDWHPPDRVQRSVDALTEGEADICGTSSLLFYDVASDALHTIPAVGEHHVCAGTMAYKRTYWEGQHFAEVPHTEEREFLVNFTVPMTQLAGEPWRLLVCISHGDNVLPKNTGLPRSPLSLDDVVPDAEARAFYRSLEQDDW